MKPFLDIVTTICIGLMIGTEFAVSAFVNPILRQLSGSAEAQATRLFARRLGKVMPFWYGLSLVLLIVETFVRRQHAGVSLLSAASAIWAGVIALTVLLLVPINNRIATMNSDAFTESVRREQAKWELLHRWRIFALGVAMTSFLVGIRLSR